MEKQNEAYEPIPSFYSICWCSRWQVLCLGWGHQGKKKEYVATVEIFDPVHDTWTASVTSGDAPACALYNDVSVAMDDSSIFMMVCSLI